MKKLICTLFIALFTFGSAYLTPASAFIPTVDTGKTASKFSQFVSKVQAKIQQAVKWVTDSKFGQFVGDGIKATKDGVAFAKDMYAGAMEIYGNVQDKISDVKDSKEYKSAMISKEIAEESKKLQQLQEEKLKAEQDIEAQISLADEEAQAKLERINQNYQAAQAAIKESNSPDSEQELAAAREDMEQQIKAINDELALKSRSLKRDLDDKTEGLDQKIKKQLKTVAIKTKELAEVAEVKVVSDNPLEVIQKTQEELFLKPGEDLTLSKEMDIREKWFTERRNVIYESYEKALKAKAELTALQEGLQSIQDLAGSMPGKSETAGVNSKIILKQGEYIRRYVEFVLADLKLETTVEIAKQLDYQPSDRLNKFRLCNYTNQSQGLADTKDKLSNAVSAAKEAKQQAENKVESATEKYNQAKEITDQTSGLINNVDQLKGSAPSPQSAVKDML